MGSKKKKSQKKKTSNSVKFKAALASSVDKPSALQMKKIEFEANEKEAKKTPTAVNHAIINKATTAAHEHDGESDSSSSSNESKRTMESKKASPMGKHDASQSDSESDSDSSSSSSSSSPTDPVTSKQAFVEAPAAPIILWKPQVASDESVVVPRKVAVAHVEKVGI